MLSINWSDVWKMVESIKVPLIVIGVALAKKTSTKTIVVINAANVFQLGELQDDPEINANVSGLFAEEDPFNKDTQTQPSFVNYNDSIYVGYRWYETAAAEGVIDYANSVVYPFGYGLSRYNDVTVEPTPEALANSNYTELDFQDGQVSADFLDALGAIDFGMTFKE